MQHKYITKFAIVHIGFLQAQEVLPDIADLLDLPRISEEAFALVGLASTLAGVCRVPLTALLLLFELTQDYNILAPSLLAVGISYWVASLGGR